LPSRQITNDVPHERQDLKNGGNDGEHRRSQSEREVNRQKERTKVNGSERKSLAGKQMFQMRRESPEEVEGGNDEERPEGEEKREFASFEQQDGQVERRHAEADDPADQAEGEAADALLPRKPTRIVARILRGRRR